MYSYNLAIALYVQLLKIFLVWPDGEYTYLLTCQGLDSKITATLRLYTEHSQEASKVKHG